MSFVLVKNSANTITTMTNIFFGSIPRPQKLKSRSIKNAKKITYSEWKSFAFETVTFFCNITFLILVTIYSALRDYIKTQEEVWFINDSMLVSALFSSVFQTLSYLNDIDVENMAENDDKADRIITPSEYLFGAVKAVFLLIHPSEFLADRHFNNFLFRDANTLLTMISYFRIVFVFLYLSKTTRYYGTRISRLLSVYGHRSKSTNFMYSIKCLFKEKGMLANTFLLFFTISFLGLLSLLVSNETDMLSQMYYCVETMATIGYGEFTIETSMQRLIFVMVIILGSLAASVFTIDLLEFLELKEKQMKAYRLLKRLQYQDKIKEKKEELIKKFFAVERKGYQKKQHSAWLQFEKQLQVDKSPMQEFLTVKYTYFCNSLKTLLQRQLLSSNLLMFYLKRRENYDIIEEKKEYYQNPLYGMPQPGKRRVDDSHRLFALKQKILGYSQ